MIVYINICFKISIIQLFTFTFSLIFGQKKCLDQLSTKRSDEAKSQAHKIHGPSTARGFN